MLNRLFLPLAVAFALCITPALAQNGSLPVTGTVRDQSGAPLPGATVSVEGTTTGTVTDAAGKFSLKIPGEAAILVAESLGYKSVKMKAGTRRNFDFVLEEDTEFLDEVVVIGFGEAKKADLTGSVAVVKMQDVENTATISVDQALQGRVAGADIMSVSGDPTEGTSIRIRGAASPHEPATKWRESFARQHHTRSQSRRCRAAVPASTRYWISTRQNKDPGSLLADRPVSDMVSKYFYSRSNETDAFRYCSWESAVAGRQERIIVWQTTWKQSRAIRRARIRSWI